MKNTVLSLSALMLSTGLLVSGNTFLMTLLGVRMSLEQVDSGIIGWVLVCYSLGFVVGTLYCPRIIERVGHIRSFAVFCALMAMACLLHPVSVHPLPWAMLRGAVGISMAGLLLIIESWFSTRATNENRGTLFAVYQVLFYLSAAGGQLLVSMGNPGTFMPFSIAALFLIAALVPLALTRLEAPAIEQTVRLSFRELYKISPLGLLAAMVSGVVTSAFNNLAPVYGHQINMNVQEIAIFMSTAVLAAMVFAWPLGRISDLFDRRLVMLILALIAATSSLGTALFGQANLFALFLSAQLFIGIASAIYPIAVAVTNDKLHSHQIVAASAGLLLSYGVGSCIGPILGSSMVSALGPDGLFFATTAVLVILSLYTFWFIQHSKRVPVQIQETFVQTMPISTSILVELDPRNEEFTETPSPDLAADEAGSEEISPEDADVLNQAPPEHTKPPET